MISRRLKIILSYDGTDFYGWQIQNEGRTVQGVLEEALSRMHKKSIRVTAAGRTDSGVHARGQVCHFDTELDIPENRFRNAINTFLPVDISVIHSVFVDVNFHARFSAKRRVYKYYFTDSIGYNVFNRRFCTQIRDIPEIDILNTCAEKLRGIHDFTTFTSAGDKNESKIREIYSASFYKEGDLIVFQIDGNAFLW
ncbi:MAG: tRNA pseudouridine(38-40) synthase TruA [Spirochaetia bacterium]|jgi:tRNA pseudouridine38-40 synthase|nr:tRNA pseudouridine(38-40) synthase TruA [Spirochaetia bacterium]